MSDYRIVIYPKEEKEHSIMPPWYLQGGETGGPEQTWTWSLRANSLRGRTWTDTNSKLDDNPGWPNLRNLITDKKRQSSNRKFMILYHTFGKRKRVVWIWAEVRSVKAYIVLVVQQSTTQTNKSGDPHRLWSARPNIFPHKRSLNRLGFHISHMKLQFDSFQPLAWATKLASLWAA